MLRCHTSSPKGKDQNLIRCNSVAGAYLPAFLLADPNVHLLIKSVQLPTPELPKRLYLIFLWVEFSQMDTIPIVNPLLNTVRIFGGRWGAHSYLASPKNNKKKDNFRNWPPILVLNC